MKQFLVSLRGIFIFIGVLWIIFFLSIAASNAGWKDTIKYSNGDKYESQWRNDNMEGEGTYLSRE